ncbi:glycoside hydrolase family 2 TIM barrel-domain containing protein [Occultella gossypii]|uniref:Carboxypeptidase regulatory-like domain-containing protein n=1 Tax=Occultella gossypii TaxID=2800820 RepID=A0ABS7SC26_9MICO|nr:glycoside hydrolase family 2 TIM barrel-domain containing protein [Occultella gossypii]MBZ2197895.1 carboxypeptidase regulatory-like domain-containing protein [Occultella gossypii]
MFGKSGRSRFHVGATLITACALLLPMALANAAPGEQEPPEASPPSGPTVTVRGQVVEAGSGEPIEGASVHASRTEVVATSGPDGTFVLRDVPRAAALVIAAREGYAFASAAVGSSVRLELEPDSEPARGEYPRPDADRRPFTDDAWLSLNGTWSFAFDPEDVGEAERWYDPGHRLDRAIRVPFGYQSLAAWGEEELATTEVFQSAFADYRGTVWYQRSFTVPADFPHGAQVRLRIGAADYGAAVWLDGAPVLPYSGDGYTEISTDLGMLAPGSTHTLAIRVVAPATDAQTPYPQGKQTGEAPGGGGASEGWFSDIGGIWQSVWIEPYRGARLTQTHVTPELTFEGDSRTPSEAFVTIDVTAEGVRGRPAVTVAITDPEGRTVLGRVRVPLTDGRGSVRVPIEDPHLWDPDDPALYTADFRLLNDDGVRIFFGMRSIERDWAAGHEGEYQYIYLNNRPIYVRGVLDQGYNPWGIYTYTGVTAGPDLRTGTVQDPGRGSMVLDLQNARDLGFNLVRHHLKVNEPAYYHWADKLGLLIWYDMPNAGWGSQGDPQAEQLYEELLTNSLQRDHNHPSIVIWTAFNESWGLTDRPFQDPIPPGAFGYVRRMVDLIREVDPSRLVVDNSPCCQNGHLEGSTDLNDFHFYLDTYDAWKNLLDGFVGQLEPGSSRNFNDGVQEGQPWLNSEFAVKGGQFQHSVSLFRSYPEMTGYVGVQIAETEQEVQSPFRYDRQPNSAEFLDHEGRARTIEMFQADDAVVLMTRTSHTLERGETIDVPVRISHFSDLDLSGAQLRWRIGGYDDDGRWVGDAGGGSRAIAPERYTVTDTGTVAVTTPEDLRVGYVWFWIEVDGETVAEQYLTFDTPSGDGEAGFSPTDVAGQEWTGGAAAHGDSDWVAGYGSGYFEYEVPVPAEIRTGAEDEATLVLEVASAQTPGVYDRNHVTSARRYPTNLTVSVGGQELPSVLLPDDPNGPLAVAGRSRGTPTGDFGNRYGYRIAVPVTASQVGDGDTVTVRLASDGGGLAVFGARSGRHGHPPVLVGGTITVPEERPGYDAVDTRLSVHQAAAEISPATGAGTVIVSVVNDTAERVEDIEVGLATPEGWTTGSQSPSPIASLEPGEARHVAFAVEAAAETAPGQTVEFTATAGWDGRAIQATSVSTVAFDPAAYGTVGVADDFTTDSSDEYTVLQPPASTLVPEVTFGAGALQAQADAPYFGMVAHRSGPVGSQVAVVVEHGSFASNGITPDAQFNGLLRDENNYVMAWTGIGGNFGVDIMVDGVLTNACCTPYRLQPGDRWAFVLDGNSIAIWINAGLGWSRLRTATTQGRIDFTEPGALEGWHYAVGMRSGGVQTITSLEGRSRESHG